MRRRMHTAAASCTLAQATESDQTGAGCQGTLQTLHEIINCMSQLVKSEIPNAAVLAGYWSLIVIVCLGNAGSNIHTCM